MIKILKQAFSFFGISGAGWILDFIIYNILSGIFKINVDTSNFISSLIGVTFVFFISTRKLFINKSKINTKVKYIIYIVYQLILIFIASRIMVILKAYLSEVNLKLIVNNISIVVKIIITPFTMIINYIFMKKLIEKI